MSERERMLATYAVILATKGKDSLEKKVIRQALVLQLGEQAALDVEELVSRM